MNGMQIEVIGGVFEKSIRLSAKRTRADRTDFST